ncbi:MULTISPECIES: outer membrane beta-barrel protein [Leeuwenhoekiella]|uniref:Outer membrane protein beta-barrel domain-containing protein n=1 Tax=Leeuwenhoekiella blandensis (strain CECT 7118 / CCUG 51940 / KCTC 22103 / MED217) TaxID=398720 RepID=A3XGW8_LEEBM|nr:MULTISPECIES: outer membrane beta-barrel protein [Leeuwenhoekiella]EAQ51478.1 hypothetical protein MED217_18085 [Leeuwenhoekiella blandensis MED217]MAO45219.1 PorT family protein [Leeuwenhoekiella sp.]MBQ51264.1 PorT family protein [Leeuwenhoekiella sp.]HBT11251.1 PorT family protein [Leeuwenhoekiella sp.]HCW65146.1 PorT family protein [Leeuwenhoekiella sp.]
MKEQKNIDRLFQEKFKDYEATPSDKVWAGIVDKQKKRRTVIPLWLQLGGAAAVLALLILAGNFIFTPADTPDAEIVLEETKTLEDNNNIEITNTSEKNTAVATSEEESAETREQNNPHSNRSSVINTETSKTVAQTSQNEKADAGNNTATSKPTQPVVTDTTSSYGIAQSNQNNNANPLQQQNTAAENQANAIAATENVSKDDRLPAEETKSLQEIADAQKEDAIADAEVEDPKSKTDTRWGITPMVAPVYYNSFGGSGIASEFADNKKSGDVNFSYGVQVSYAVTNKLTVRSGINKVDLGYRTEQINFAPTIQARSISSIDYNQSSQLIQIADGNKSLASSAAEFANNSTVAGTSINNALHQELGYIEVPFEAEYALLDRKVGIQVIGGFSTLFLNNNSISLEESNSVSRLGASNSLNNTSFSTNVGLGLDYKFTDRIQFNLEPMFKYQLNAYTKTVSDFRPYYLGLYTGLSIKF